MQHHTIFEAPGLTISYDFSYQWIYANWYGTQTQESVRVGCRQLLEIIGQWPTIKILSDNTNITRLDFQLTGWGINWLQDMRTAGLRYLAWVYAPNFAFRQASERLATLVQQPTVAVFDNLPSAHSWLHQQKSTY